MRAAISPAAGRWPIGRPGRSRSYNNACRCSSAAECAMHRGVLIVNTIHTPETTKLHERIATTAHPAPPAKRSLDGADDLMLTVIPPLVGALAGLVILMAVGL